MAIFALIPIILVSYPVPQDIVKSLDPLTDELTKGLKTVQSLMRYVSSD